MLLYQTAFFNPQCTLEDNETFVTKEPEHGVVAIEVIENYANFSADSPRAKCNEKKVAMPTITYRSVAGYTGADTFEVTSVSPSGFRYVYSYTLSIIDRGPTKKRADNR